MLNKDKFYWNPEDLELVKDAKAARIVAHKILSQHELPDPEDDQKDGSRDDDDEGIEAPG